MRRRTLLGAAALLPLGARVMAATPPAETITPALIEAAKKEGGEIEAYVTLRSDTAQIIWKLFETQYPFLRVKPYKADSDKMLQRVQDTVDCVDPSRYEAILLSMTPRERRNARGSSLPHDCGILSPCRAGQRR